MLATPICLEISVNNSKNPGKGRACYKNIEISLLIAQLIYFLKSSWSYSNTATIALVQFMVILWMSVNAEILKF